MTPTMTTEDGAFDLTPLEFGNCSPTRTFASDVVDLQDDEWHLLASLRLNGERDQVMLFIPNLGEPPIHHIRLTRSPIGGEHRPWLEDGQFNSPQLNVIANTPAQTDCALPISRGRTLELQLNTVREMAEIAVWAKGAGCRVQVRGCGR